MKDCDHKRIMHTNTAFYIIVLNVAGANTVPTKQKCENDSNIEQSSRYNVHMKFHYTLNVAGCKLCSRQYRQTVQIVSQLNFGLVILCFSSY